MFRNPSDCREFPNQDEISCPPGSCPLRERFADQRLADRICMEIHAGKSVDIEAQQRVLGQKPSPANQCEGDATDRMDMEAPWYAIKLRTVRDPVSSEKVILYIAQNITDRVQAKRDKSEADRENMAKSEFLAVMGRYGTATSC